MTQYLMITRTRITKKCLIETRAFHEQFSQVQIRPRVVEITDMAQLLQTAAVDYEVGRRLQNRKIGPTFA